MGPRRSTLSKWERVGDGSWPTRAECAQMSLVRKAKSETGELDFVVTVLGGLVI